MANGAVMLCRMKRRSARCDRLPIDSRAAALAIAVASEAGQGQQQLVQQGRSAMTPPRPAAMDGAEPKRIVRMVVARLRVAARGKACLEQGPAALLLAALLPVLSTASSICTYDGTVDSMSRAVTVICRH